MVQINFAKKQVNAKIVYYGPGMSGKTTNLEVIHQRAPEGNRGELTSISTEGDRTLFFDFMPLDLGTVAGMKTSFQIYTVPGQVYYNSTRKLVLQGVDGVIFVADSSPNMMEENLESLRNLAVNLKEYGRGLDEMPMVIQYNKRDMPGALSIEELEEQLNVHGAPAFEAIANTGQGVFPTLKAVAAAVLDSLHRQQDASRVPSHVAEAPRAAAPSVPAGGPPPASRPTTSMSQTGFHKPPSLPLETAARTAPAEPAPAQSLRMAPPVGNQDPSPVLSQNSPDQSLQMKIPAPSQAGATPAQFQQPAAQQMQSAAHTMLHVPAVQAVAAPQKQGAAPTGVMGVEAGATAPARRMPGRKTFTPTPAPEARATPAVRKKRSAVVTAVIVVGSVGIGAALGGFVLSIL
jgi:signal recognition particle receptor subunit beta